MRRPNLGKKVSFKFHGEIKSGILMQNNVIKVKSNAYGRNDYYHVSANEIIYP